MDDREAIIDVTVQWEKSYMRGDIEACVSFYSEDATMMTFDGVIARGRDEIRNLCAGKQATNLDGAQIC